MQLSKRQRFGLITFVLLLLIAYLVTTEPWEKSNSGMQTSLEPETTAMEIRINWVDLPTGYPLAPHADTILSYTGFDLGYNEQFEQAAWVTYVLTREEIESGTVERSDNFKSDKNISTGSASLADYRGSGYDRGIWKKLESEVRNWAIEKDSIYVITGPVLSSIDSFIGENQVGIPPDYYKVLVDLSPPDHSVIAFLLPNSSSSDSLEKRQDLDSWK